MTRMNEIPTDIDSQFDTPELNRKTQRLQDLYQEKLIKKFQEVSCKSRLVSITRVGRCILSFCIDFFASLTA